MGSITFASMRRGERITVPVPAGEPRPLLTVARDAGVPILFNCESGGCGACLVRVQSRGGSPGALADLSADEEFLLDAMGKLTPEDTGIVAAPGTVEGYRLACQAVVGGADLDITVFYEDRVGGG